MTNLNIHDQHVQEYLALNFTNPEKAQALASHLNLNTCEIAESVYDSDQFDAEGSEYMVLTDSEADDRALEYIKDSVWAFNASFLADFTDLPEEIFVALQDGCESSNDVVLKLIERSHGIEYFAEQAISCDGRGHFLSSYDGEENEAYINGEWFYIYRTN